MATKKKARRWRQHKWDHGHDGVATCLNCGMQFRAVAVDRPKVGVSEFSHVIQYSVGGQWVKMRRSPPCGAPLVKCSACHGEGVVPG